MLVKRVLLLLQTSNFIIFFVRSVLVCLFLLFLFVDVSYFISVYSIFCFSSYFDLILLSSILCSWSYYGQHCVSDVTSYIYCSHSLLPDFSFALFVFRYFIILRLCFWFLNISMCQVFVSLFDASWSKSEVATTWLWSVATSAAWYVLADFLLLLCHFGTIMKSIWFSTTSSPLPYGDFQVKQTYFLVYII